MAVAKTLLTAEDLLALPSGNGKRYELVNGELIEMSAAGYRHGKVAGNAYRLVSNFAYDNQLGDVLAAETGFLLRRDPDHVRGADVAFVRAGRLTFDPLGYAELAPDFVVEVISPGDRASDVQERINDWLDAGTSVVWAVYPSFVVIWRGRDRAERRSGDDLLDAEPVLPGFRCTVSDLLGADPAPATRREGNP